MACFVTYPVPNLLKLPLEVSLQRYEMTCTHQETLAVESLSDHEVQGLWICDKRTIQKYRMRVRGRKAAIPINYGIVPVQASTSPTRHRILTERAIRRTLAFHLTACLRTVRLRAMLLVR